MRSLGVLLEWVAGSILFVLLAVGVLQVTSRYTGLMFVPWTEEVARLLFVWVVWIGAAAAVFRGSHIRFDFLIERLPKSMQVGIGTLVTLGLAGFLSLLVYQSYEIVRSTSSTFITINLSVKYTYLSVVVGSSLMLVGLLGTMLPRLRGTQGRRGSHP
jgi:TRAP-type C4-dicarboxylate transport system permease small subunit